MSERKTHWVHVCTKSGQYASCKDALKDIAALRMHLMNECKNKDYGCIAYAGVSENDHNAGIIQCGKQGKKLFIVKKGADVIAAEPHIHIFMLANPAGTVSQKILDYLSRKGIEARYYFRDEDSMKVLFYVMKQSKKNRTIICNTDQLPADSVSDFYKVAEIINEELHGCTPVFGPLSKAFYRAVPKTDPFKLYLLEEIKKIRQITGKTACV